MKNGDLFEDTAVWFIGVAGVLAFAGVVAACIIAPLNGHWEPDIALAGWSTLAAIVYGVYRVRLWLRG